MLRYLLLLSVLIPFVLVGCSDDQSETSQTLSLTLLSEQQGFTVSDYRILDEAFQQSQQQGLYQAHLHNEEGDILRRISFEKIEVPDKEGKVNEVKFFVTLPLVPNLDRILFYQLDGSSGHYQVKTDNPLLNWPLPEALERKVSSSQ